MLSSPFAKEPPGPLVLVIVSGLSGLELERRLASGELPPHGGFATLLANGHRAERLIPIDAPESGISGASLHTGVYPEVHGIVGYDFRVLGDSLSQPTDLLDVEMDAESLFEAAARQGLRTYRILTYPDRAKRGDLPLLNVLARLERRGEPYDLALELEPPDDMPRPMLDPDGSPATLEIRPGEPVELLLSRTGEGFQLRAGSEADRLAWTLDRGRWNALSLPGDAPAHAFARLFEQDESRVRLLLLPPQRFSGRPQAFIRRLGSALVPFPVGLSSEYLHRGAQDALVWLDVARSGYRGRREIALWALRQGRADLVAVRMSMDPAGHHLYATDARHSLEPSERSRKLAEFASVLGMLDRELEELLHGAPAHTTFVVLSDHGMMTSHSTIRIHEAMASAGFRVPPAEDYEVRALSSYGSALVYFNVRGREPDGVVPDQGVGELGTRLTDTLRALRDPITNEPVLDLVADRARMKEHHYAHPVHAPDLWLVARPGYTFDEAPAEGEDWLVPETPYLGMHGFLSKYRENHGFFVVMGPTVEPGLGPALRVTEVVGQVSKLLGIDPPERPGG